LSVAIENRKCPLPLVSAWPFWLRLNAVGEISPDIIHGIDPIQTQREKKVETRTMRKRKREGQEEMEEIVLSALPPSLSLSLSLLFVALRGSLKSLFDAFYGVV